MSLYYIAFFKGGTKFWNSDDIKDRCNTAHGYHVLGFGCGGELAVQLATILATNMFVGQATEIGIPWVMENVLPRILRMLGISKPEHKHEQLPQWEREAKLIQFAGTLDEYSEMVIQYGYITLFATAFPLAPLMAVLNNMVEIRTDAFKLLTIHSRPEYKGAVNIGSWYLILEVIGVFAVITNCLLIGFAFQAINYPLNENVFQTFAIIVIIEHVILFLKFIISILIPDAPGWIKAELAKQQYFRQLRLKQLAQQNMRSHWSIHKNDGASSSTHSSIIPVADN